MENQPASIPPDSLTLIQDLEARQDDLLKQLDELNHRVEAALNDFLRSNAPAETETVEAPQQAPLRRAA